MLKNANVNVMKIHESIKNSHEKKTLRQKLYEIR